MSTERTLKKRKTIYRDETTAGFLDEVARLESCLREGEKAARRLPFGCLLRMARPARGVSTRMLQIFLDPLLFRSWTAGIEPVEVMYANPCGIELVKQATGRWALFLDGEELLLDLKVDKPYEMARFEVVDSFDGGREVVRIK